MKTLKLMTVLCLAVSLTGMAAHAEQKQYKKRMYEVPFYNAVIEAGRMIRAEYKMTPGTQTLVCTKTAGDGSDSVTWDYHDTQYKGQMPLTLKSHASYGGEWADEEGKLMIKNESLDSGPITVSCEYKAMQ